MEFIYRFQIYGRYVSRGDHLKDKQALGKPGRFRGKISLWIFCIRPVSLCTKKNYIPTSFGFSTISLVINRENLKERAITFTFCLILENIKTIQNLHIMISMLRIIIIKWLPDPSWML